MADAASRQRFTPTLSQDFARFIDLVCNSRTINFTAGTSATSARRRNYKPPQKGDLDHVREERMKELKMSEILREIFSYLLFLWLLTVLSYGNRDPNAYYMQMNLKNEFINNPKFKEVSSNSPERFCRRIRSGSRHLTSRTRFPLERSL